ncbi:MAG: methylmalonyl Co-A mutase-associated GTPase MeaB, partial [Bacteroidota bacterium]|nr:methylmalonyl Co-A mutase-associated GTPase MeaB [Bacteroidota bacterium]MDX5431918.1 methylmalonyl Co-A mutase-associated GTPase MeaB [Bacteroidota bacterium]MDX5470633.1 methylmalonyl Co-A mutase-associated GTPase MeaB [Bacteroidota bacterium]
GLLINKADGDNAKAAKRAAADYRNALHLFREPESKWLPQVETVSSLQKEGMDRVYTLIKAYENQTRLNGFFDQNRHLQDLSWLNEMIREELYKNFAQFEKSSAVWQEEIAHLKMGISPVRSVFKRIMEEYRK